MDRRGFILSLALAPVAVRAGAQEAERFVFASIDGGELDLASYWGGPVLVVNTASFCSQTPQYNALQDLWDRYRGRGLTVVGVPSQSFGQELDSSGAVKDFCEVNFGINFPMTELVEVAGPEAHPFFIWAQAEGAAPRWNFHKILLDGDGRIAGSFGTTTSPDSPKLAQAIEALLPDG
jgi:glutathione peroxidase